MLTDPSHLRPRAPSNSALLTVLLLGERLRSLAAKLVPIARQTELGGLSAAESKRPGYE